MNERIRELAEQAGMESADFPYDEFGMPWEQKKFAELIVRECAKVSATKAGVYDKDAFVTKRIKEHFGVER